MRAIGKIQRLSINKPISVSTLIFFLNKLYELHKKATMKPIHGKESKLKSKYIDEMTTAKIAIFL